MTVTLGNFNSLNSICYRDYETFHNDVFRTELENELFKHDTYNTEYQHFSNVFLGILNGHTLVSWH